MPVPEIEIPGAPRMEGDSPREEASLGFIVLRFGGSIGGYGFFGRGSGEGGGGVGVCE